MSWETYCIIAVILYVLFLVTSGVVAALQEDSIDWEDTSTYGYMLTLAALCAAWAISIPCILAGLAMAGSYYLVKAIKERRKRKV